MIINISQLSEGDVVYVVYRNPHAQSVATIQEAHITEHPDQPGELSLFLLESYYPLDRDYAMYTSYEEAVAAYTHYFEVDEDVFYG
ncbi:transcriptional regulator [Bacillaceae bacterium SIJ1]|uniref:transcriptional regulator SplA domain-containing protein n=1 Tax=Litoribacterium kuwaitense TaxID=1398745 RepID=UPI0013EA8BAC|nr:transcriptional regulator SplA domain-containing protein [Litoribacterium kuwaitense]NGP45054.1 transcriptional regulator [Litoribacterium kuwaitense]